MLTALDHASSLEQYVVSVEAIARAVLEGQPAISAPAIAPLLDGHAAQALRETVPLAVRRDEGLFFSGTALRAALLSDNDAGLYRRPVLDPTVGGGDLLIEVTRKLPVAGNLADTLQLWAPILHGRDVRPEMIRLARARLVLQAFARTGRAAGRLLTLERVLPGLKIGDGMPALKRGWRTGHLVLNPPFTSTSAPQAADWTSGLTNTAALFVAAAVEHAADGVAISAILPDVLRTGSRYVHLRTLLGSKLQDLRVRRYGQFDPWTDVDVFLLNGVIRRGAELKSPILWWNGAAKTTATVGEKFHVRVGSVVPHRHVESGAPKPFLHARSIPLGGEFDVAGSEKRSFTTTTFRPPFVVVRRTSRPGDRSRGLGTLALGDADVLVENHLMILSPRDSSVSTCEALIKHLRSASARDWLDERIRCRHITAAALRDMPWSQNT